MGCFSYICKESGEPVNSGSFPSSSDAAHLFLLKDGKVVEYMYGLYDSYGRVFDKDEESFEWEMGWDKVCELDFDTNSGNGIAAVLDYHYKGIPPTTQSEHDPDQGWGKSPNKYRKLTMKSFHRGSKRDKLIEKLDKIIEG